MKPWISVDHNVPYRFGGGSIMVWVGLLVCLNTSLTSDHYTAQLCNYGLYMNTNNDTLFQQDKAPCHVAKVAQNCFEEYSVDFQ